tara:strand:- start:251 stop:880 length:630 start_codon:yes stop_codon:yes gene_type:complete
MRQGISIVISAPSGTGKSTIFKQLRKKLPNVEFSISHTTRPARPGEKDGIDYFFISQHEFERKIEDGAFIEWANVHGYYYGTSFDSVHKIRSLESHILIELDVKGVAALKRINFNGIYIMIMPPSLKELYNRLSKRSTESDEEIKRRLAVGKVEITHYPTYDYVVTNNEVNESVNIILQIIGAEEHRSSRYIPTASDIIEVLQSSLERS